MPACLFKRKNDIICKHIDFLILYQYFYIHRISVCAYTPQRNLHTLAALFFINTFYIHTINKCAYKPGRNLLLHCMLIHFAYIQSVYVHTHLTKLWKDLNILTASLSICRVSPSLTGQREIIRASPVCLCMYICMYVSVYVCKRDCQCSLCLYVYVCVYMNDGFFLYICLLYIRMYSLCMYACYTYVCIYFVCM